MKKIRRRVVRTKCGDGFVDFLNNVLRQQSAADIRGAPGKLYAMFHSATMMLARKMGPQAQR
ncbi:hypothetical protein [Pararobbsia silviterrae]|uniref:hypothetical protein n=1 Tax=Pararobbsia silviterrae TaxID=1792498 RepID=UPI0011C431D8|nr:hypothetical protein [Pararobbsia silviterrae]